MVRKNNAHNELRGLIYLFRGTGVIILNFVADSLANIFLSGMFVRRYKQFFFQTIVAFANE